MEKCLLSLLSLGKELDVINHKNVTGAIFLTELIALCTVLFHAHLHEFTDHLLTVDVHNLCARRFLEKIVADCVKKVGFAKTDTTVYKQRIIFATGVFCNGLCSNESIVVGFAHDKIVKGVSIHKRILFCLCFCRLLSVVNDDSTTGKEIRLLFEIFFLLVGSDDLNVCHCAVERVDNFNYGLLVFIINSAL